VHLLIPPILIVLDDYDVLYKEQGVDMVHTMIKKLDPLYISRYGLDNVFFEVKPNHDAKHLITQSNRPIVNL
jgi:hypothetical protein